MFWDVNRTQKNELVDESSTALQSICMASFTIYDFASKHFSSHNVNESKRDDDVDDRELPMVISSFFYRTLFTMQGNEKNVNEFPVHSNFQVLNNPSCIYIDVSLAWHDSLLMFSESTFVRFSVLKQ